MLSKKKFVKFVSLGLSLSLLAGCGNSSSSNKEGDVTNSKGQSTEETTPEESNSTFAGEELSIIVSTGWMDNRYDNAIASFENEYEVTVDLQTIPPEQYGDILQSKLSTGTNSDIFWIQSNPFAIETTIVNPEEYCIDFTGEKWQSKIPEERLESCMYDGKLYGMQLWHNSPEYVMLYNKTLFEEMKLEIPKTYNEFKTICEKIYAEDITPWFMPGADGWQQQLAFFQISAVFENSTPGLYEDLNTNQATFADNETMLTVLEQFKELSDAGYLGEDWIGTDSSNMPNDFADRKIAMALSNSSFIEQIIKEGKSEDEFGLFILPLADNEYFPANPAGPTMFGYKDAKNPALVKEFFNFISTTESLQSILDNSPQYTNIAANDDAIVQRWLPEEKEFMDNLTDEQIKTPVIQTATKYTNDYWMQFGSDMVSYCLDQIEANDVLKNMDKNRADAAKLADDLNWK